MKRNPRPWKKARPVVSACAAIWEESEVYRACRALEIPLTEIPRYWPE